MFDAILNPLTVGIVGAVLALIIVVSIVVRRYRIATPDEAIIVTGRKGKTIKNEEGEEVTDLSGQKVVTGGGIFVLPFVQQSFNLSLRSRRLLFATTAQTRNGITITADAVAVIKVGGDEQMIRAAAQRFLSQQDEIETSTKEVLSGSLRGIIGTLTVEEIIQDRQALAEAVLQAAEDALTKQGLVIDTLQIQGVDDETDYIKNLGRPEAANVRRAAEVADTAASRDAEQARLTAEQAVLENQRALRIRQAAVQAETDKAAAEADAARPLAEATQRQAIVAQQEITAQREAALREQQLVGEVNKVADAEAYRVRINAQANAEARRLEAQAEADAIAARGEAEAAAAKAKGLAEADAIAARAAALEKEASAVLAQQALEVLPKVAAEFAKSYEGADITIISADGTNKLVGDVAGGMQSVLEATRKATGIDLQGVIQGRVSGEAAGRGFASEQV